MYSILPSPSTFARLPLPLPLPMPNVTTANQLLHVSTFRLTFCFLLLLLLFLCFADVLLFLLSLATTTPSTQLASNGGHKNHTQEPSDLWMALEDVLSHVESDYFPSVLEVLPQITNGLLKFVVNALIQSEWSKSAATCTANGAVDIDRPGYV